MLSLRQSLAQIGRHPPVRIPQDVPMSCKSLRDMLITWNKTPYDLLIISPQEFMDALGPLVDHKNNTGITTMLRSLEHIYQAYSGRDEAEQVKRCLALFQPNNQVRYAMLVGDGDKFPSRYVKWWNIVPGHEQSDPEFHTLYLPVDLYYGALFKRSDGSFDDWDGDQDGYFGEIPKALSTVPINLDDVNVIPDLAVGRIPASTVEEVRCYVSKVIGYENGAYGCSWTKATLLVATSDWTNDAYVNQDHIAASSLHDFTVYKLYERRFGLRQSLALINKHPPIRIPEDVPMQSKSLWENLAAWNQCTPTESPRPEAINAYIDQGVGFVSYIGHGSREGWEISYGRYGFPEVANLSNSGRLPVVFSMGCDTGSFATLPPLTAYQDINGYTHQGTIDGEIFSTTPAQPACLQAKDYESMAEEMTVKRDTGAIAYIGSVTTGGYYALDLLESFSKALAGRKILGDMWQYMLKTYYQKHNPPNQWATMSEDEIGYFLQPWRYQLFGDPSLRVGGIPHFQIRYVIRDN
jgi:hypothetical protein